MTRWRSVKRLLRATAACWLVLALATPGAVFASTIQVGFSPEGSARTLVLDVIGSAHHSLWVMAYSLTASDITRALVQAHKRGVDVRVVVDKGESGRRYMTHALNTLVDAGVPVRTDSHYKIQHDKVIIADGQTTETGSFNYSRAAEVSNSENALVIWNYPAIASAYLKHWRSRWDQGVAYHPTY